MLTAENVMVTGGGSVGISRGPFATNILEGLRVSPYLTLVTALSNSLSPPFNENPQ